MTYSKALLLIKNLNSPDPDANVMEKAEAILKVMSMETINAVTKDDLLQCVRWLWHREFEIDKEDDEK